MVFGVESEVGNSMAVSMAFVSTKQDHAEPIPDAVAGAAWVYQDEAQTCA